MLTMVTLFSQKRCGEREERDISKRKCIPASCRIPVERGEALTSLLAQLPNSPLRENKGDLPPGVSQHCMLGGCRVLLILRGA